MTAQIKEGRRTEAPVLGAGVFCTIRIIPFRKGPLGGSRQRVLDVFAPLGVSGEGIERFGIVALDVPPGADIAAVKRVLRDGERDAWWEYEEGCVGGAWLAAG